MRIVVAEIFAHCAVRIILKPDSLDAGKSNWDASHQSIYSGYLSHYTSFKSFQCIFYPPLVSHFLAL